MAVTDKKTARKSELKQALKTKNVLIMDEDQMNEFNRFLQEFPGKFCNPVMAAMRQFITVQEVPEETKK